MKLTPTHLTVEVWAQLFLSSVDCIRLREFFVQKFNVKPRYVVRSMHITIYHARRPLIGLTSVSESVRVVIPADETRFMVLAPGGENPRPHLDPAVRKVGIRIHKQSVGQSEIRTLRDRLLQYETPAVLGRRLPSTYTRSAFGARSFQPHMAILRAGSGVHQDLTPLGLSFREEIGDLTFDRFQIEVACRFPIE